MLRCRQCPPGNGCIFFAQEYRNPSAFRWHARAFLHHHLVNIHSAHSRAIQQQQAAYSIYCGLLFAFCVADNVATLIYISFCWCARSKHMPYMDAHRHVIVPLLHIREELYSPVVAFCVFCDLQFGFYWVDGCVCDVQCASKYVACLRMTSIWCLMMRLKCFLYVEGVIKTIIIFFGIISLLCYLNI